MSAFVVVFERSNTPIEPGVLERAMQRLSHRGPNGKDVCLDGNSALGHWHFWTTPEEVGEKQPLRLPGTPYTIVLDGRLDNRAEIMTGLGIDPADGHCLTDAALILRAYTRWGENCVEHFVGEFALVIHDAQHDQLICARDPLGDRTLFYTFAGSRIIIASEPWATASLETQLELDQEWAAHYFALKESNAGLTPFKDIHELLPAQLMVIQAFGERQSIYWHPEVFKRQRNRTDHSYAEEFLSLLEESVRCRLRSVAPAGVLMSGGLDSTSVTCLAARMQAPDPVTTISYVFDELPDCDERLYIDAVKAQYHIRSIQIPSDDLWPYKNSSSWPNNPNFPEGNPYRMIKERAYHRAKIEGLTVLLTGGFGDHLYTDWEEWLADSIVDRHFRRACNELGFLFKYFGSLNVLKRDPSVRRVIRRVLNQIPGGKRIYRKTESPPWLTPFATERLGLPTTINLSDRHSTLIGIMAANSASREIFNTSRHGIELRQPYRDRRLVEFVLTLPAYQFYTHGGYKLILRNAMQGILPEIIRTRLAPTSLVSLYSRGIALEQSILKPFFENSDALWAKLVEAKWANRQWKIQVTPETDGPAAVIPWLCYSFESWNQEFIRYNKERR